MDKEFKKKSRIIYRYLIEINGRFTSTDWTPTRGIKIKDLIKDNNITSRIFYIKEYRKKENYYIQSKRGRNGN